jgi:hypothetical protein
MSNRTTAPLPLQELTTQCKSDNENYCPHQVDTYNANYPNGDKAWGGYSSHIRAHEQFVFPIPDSIPSNIVAPMFCAGLTVYSPMVRHGCGPGKKVAVVGVGGLGHFALMFGKAMGAEMSAVTHSPSKAADAKKVTSPIGSLLIFRWVRLKSLIRARRVSLKIMQWNSILLSAPQTQVKKISRWLIISRIALS